jgi:CII-binding regulator of phage lambda lysogenization HflD
MKDVETEICELKQRVEDLERVMEAFIRVNEKFTKQMETSVNALAERINKHNDDLNYLAEKHNQLIMHIIELFGESELFSENKTNKERGN